jgi:Uma2 family endonuclease
MISAELIPIAEGVHIVAMPVPDTRVTTIEELQALPDDDLRHELLDGAHVVTPSPTLTHQRFLSRLVYVLEGTLHGRRDLEVFAGGDVELGPRTLVIPDLFVIRQDPDQPVQSWEEIGVPVLAVEILSPGTAVRDRGVKRRAYQEAEVDEYWIADLDAGLIERWRPPDERPEILNGPFTWQPSPDVSVSVSPAELLAT